MSDPQAGLSSTTVRKWLFFIVFLASLVLVYFIFLKPGGESEARDLLLQATKDVSNARLTAQKTKEPSDLANVDLANDALKSAQKYLIESDYSAAKTEAEKALKYASNVLEQSTPVASFKAAVRVDETLGDVTLRRNRTQALEIAKKGVPIETSDTITTALNSACKLFFASGMSAVLMPDTEIQLQEKFSGSVNITNIYLKKGELDISLVDVPDNVQLHVLTDNGKAIVNPNCQVTIDFLASQSKLQARVQKGKVDLQSGNKSTPVRNNQELAIRGNQLPALAQELPPAPQLSSPDNFADFISNQNGFALISLTWDRVEKAQNYRVQVSSNQFFTSLVRDRPFFPGTSMAFPDLTNGTYYWRVISMGANDREGLPSQARSFQIIEPKVQQGKPVDGTPPHLKIAKTQVQGYMYIIQGNSEKDATVWVNNEKAILDDYTGDFIFTASFPVAGVHEVSIVAMDRAGNRTFEKVFVEIVE